MQQRMIEFIRALRAAGVRVSLAESQDAMFGVDAAGVHDARAFKSALKASLVKDRRHQPVFDYFFPLFFTDNKPPLDNILEQLGADAEQRLQEAMQTMLSERDALRDLLQRLLEGREYSEADLRRMAEIAGLPQGGDMSMRPWLERRMERATGLSQLARKLDDLLDELAALGMDEAAVNELEQKLRENMRGLREQISQHVGASLAEQMAKQPPREKPDLLDTPLQRLSGGDMDDVRDEVRRLAARLRTRAALRQKRAKSGLFDPRKTIRKNMRYGGVPMQAQFRVRHKKPSLILICDLSTSMRYAVEFLLTLVYELGDQVRRTHSFIFIHDLVDVSGDLAQLPPREAVARIMAQNPPGYYSTDLGNSLRSFQQAHLHLVDSRSSIIIFGDGRNNYNDPRLDIAQDLQRKSRRLLWFCPEPRRLWGNGDSDMWEYYRVADRVFLVRSLRQLAEAVDRLLADS
ncbi:MAG: VWA domain-containing protein [Chloroflexi bacterium]|nr:VWA domain-containing protein [Chloroflexota bacterium]MCY4247268.1 VWA domain-containing protein [Chloroflexota bacterium]